ncbi:MAG: FemAB family XrtA/PEP-CTERM system-associated protein [Gammaproteobacteria bacterium]
MNASALPLVNAIGQGRLDVRAATPQDAAAWDRFVDAHPDGTFFHVFAWRALLAETIGFQPRYLLATRDAQVVGVLPLMEVRSLLFGNALVSLPFCVEGGILALDSPAARALLDAAKAQAETSRVAYLELRHARALGEGLLCKDATYVNFRRELAPTVDENMKAIPRKQRAVVRKGIAAGLVSHVDADIERFFPIYATSVRNLGTPVFPRRYFAALVEAFGPRCQITTITHGDTPVSSVLSFLYRDTVMPYYGGGLPAARDLKAYDFMYWEVMRTACEAGLTGFDYGRSKVDSGSYSFKKNWGFEPTPLHYEYHLVGLREMPDRNPNNPKFALAVRAWKKLPLPLANLLGPRISPFLA